MQNIKKSYHTTFKKIAKNKQNTQIWPYLTFRTLNNDR